MAHSGEETVETPQTITYQLFDEIGKEIKRLEKQLQPILARESTEKAEKKAPQTELIIK